MTPDIGILVVESNVTYAAILKRMLSTRLPDNLPVASEVVIVSDAEEALEVMKTQHHFELVITELVYYNQETPPTGKLDGCQLLEKIRNDYPGIRVIALTSWCSKTGEAVAAGFNRLLYKSDDAVKIFNEVFQATFPL